MTPKPFSDAEIAERADFLGMAQSDFNKENAAMMRQLLARLREAECAGIAKALKIANDKIADIRPYWNTGSAEMVRNAIHEAHEEAIARHRARRTGKDKET